MRKPTFSTLLFKDIFQCSCLDFFSEAIQFYNMQDIVFHKIRSSSHTFPRLDKGTELFLLFIPNPSEFIFTSNNAMHRQDVLSNKLVG